MKKKYIIVGFTCIFFLISGICYSCTFQQKDGAVLLANKSKEQTELPAKQEKSIENSNENVLQEKQQEQQPEEVPKEIYVHICGEVKEPGVYRLQAQARLVDAITLSGGLTKEAAGDYINQAQKLSDGQRVYIPSRKELEKLSLEEYLAGEQAEELTSQGTDKGSSLIDINTADLKTLMELPGIGQAKADSIISYRNANGSFKTTDELMKIPGIKEGLFRQISSLIIAN
jgi:competence protein ComEA